MRAQPPRLLAQGQGSPCSVSGPGRPGAHPAARRPPWVGERGAAALGLARGCWTWQRGEMLSCPSQGSDQDPSTAAKTALSYRPPQGTLQVCRIQSVPGDPGWQIPARNGQPPVSFALPWPLLPVHCIQTFSWRLSSRWQRHLEGQTLVAEPSGRSPGSFPRPAPPPHHELRDLCPGITFRVSCWASWQELGPCSPRSLEARQELCSSSASKASAQRHSGQAPQPLAAHPGVLYHSQNLRSKRSVTAHPAGQLPVPRGALSNLSVAPMPVQAVPTFPKSGDNGPAPTHHPWPAKKPLPVLNLTQHRPWQGKAHPGPILRVHSLTSPKMG